MFHREGIIERTCAFPGRRKKRAQNCAADALERCQEKEAKGRVVRTCRSRGPVRAMGMKGQRVPKRVF